jgi:hypothetical protein
VRDIVNQREPTTARAQAASNEASHDWDSSAIADKFCARDRERGTAPYDSQKSGVVDDSIQRLCLASVDIRIDFLQPRIEFPGLRRIFERAVEPVHFVNRSRHLAEIGIGQRFDRRFDFLHRAHSARNIIIGYASANVATGSTMEPMG